MRRNLNALTVDVPEGAIHVDHRDDVEIRSGVT